MLTAQFLTHKFKYIITILGIVLCSVTEYKVFAQEVLYSDVEKFDLSNGSCKVVGKINQKIVTYRGDKQGHYLDFYDANMSKTASAHLDYFPKQIHQTTFIVYPDQITMFFQTFENHYITLYAVNLNENGIVKNKIIRLAEVKTGYMGPTKSYFDINWSENQQHIVVVQPELNKNDVKGKLIWLDRDLTILKKNTLTYNFIKAKSIQSIVANTGDLWLAIGNTEGKGGTTNQFNIVHIPHQTNVAKGHQLDQKGTLINNHFIRFDEANQKINCGALFNTEDDNNISGLLYASFDVPTMTWQETSKQLFSEGLKEKAATGKTKRAFNNFVIRDIKNKEQGGFVLIAENYWMRMQTEYRPSFGYYSYYFSPMQSRSIREYYFGDIFAVSFDKNGQEDWSTFIRKDQLSYEDGGIFSSFGSMTTSSNLLFLYNNYHKSQSQMEISSLNSQGEVNNYGLKEVDKDNIDWLPRSAKQISSRELIIPCISKRKLCFAKVTI